MPRVPKSREDGIFVAMTSLRVSKPDMPSLRDSERRQILLCYKYAAPTGLFRLFGVSLPNCKFGTPD
ncbi:hypothetical protein [Desulfonema magnum]|uniref:Uncharacterized protein n=1 Tax=Desulfonema magnum TaxID=45655 RepID=A0A975GMU7_9BACT|nr:hypothetical protein [Desulfonema magnum]QTA87089.1 Uncharacterized protein dnm_031170 [Desulfonema magnum]